MRELSLHLLDIAENSAAAQANDIIIRLEEDLCVDRLYLSVEDNGRGMDADTAAAVLDPFITSRTTRKIGLGIPLLKEAAEACQGGLTLSSTLGRGTCLEAWFRHSHIDRMPLGDLPGTFLTLLVAHPEIHWVLDYSFRSASCVEGTKFLFDDEPVKSILGDLPLSDPEVLVYLRQTLTEGISHEALEIQSSK